MGISINSIDQTSVTYQSANATSKAQHRENITTRDASSEKNTSVTSVHGDTLTISESGKAASKNMTNQGDSNADDNSFSDDLSGYTEAELQQLYLDGTITRNEYDEELESRNA